MPKSWKKLAEAARTARMNAHAPYSRFFVGAAIETTTGVIFSGCNVENASYGGTICAERGAICKMVSEAGAVKIKRVCVILDGGSKTGGSPCGICRQVIWEFCGKDKDVPVMMMDPQGKFRMSTIGKLLPDAFTFVPPLPK